MISSHPSQYWFRVDAVYVEHPDAISDVSDVYCKNLRGHRTLKFIGYFTFFLIMAKLLPMFRKGCIPWHEMTMHSNDYPGEVGCTVQGDRVLLRGQAVVVIEGKLRLAL